MSILRSYRAWKLCMKGKALSQRTSILFSFNNFKSFISNSSRLCQPGVSKARPSNRTWPLTRAQGCIRQDLNKSFKPRYNLRTLQKTYFKITFKHKVSNSSNKIKGNHRPKTYSTPRPIPWVTCNNFNKYKSRMNILNGRSHHRCRDKWINRWERIGLGKDHHLLVALFNRHKMEFKLKEMSKELCLQEAANKNYSIKMIN